MSIIDMKGKLLRVATNLSPPYVYLEYEAGNTSWVFKGGTETKLLESLSKHFNFTYHVINCLSDWGVLLPNGTWTGIIGKIVSKKADLGFAGLTVTEERSRYVYFTHPHIVTSVSFITPPPKPEPKITLVIEPFDGLVWVSIIGFLLLFVLSEWVLTKQWILIKNIPIKWGIISSLLKQQMHFQMPDILSLRIMICFWLLACLVLTASYSGCLYSLMAVPTRVKPINTINELAKVQRKGLIQVTAIGGSSYYDFLKHSNFGVYKDIGEFIKPVKDKNSGLQIVMKSSSKPYAYISTRDHLTYGVLKFGSGTFHLPPPTEESTLFLDVMSIAFQKDFIFKNNFNKVISNFKKGGFLDYWSLTENRKLKMKGEITNNSNKNREHEILYLDQLQSAFYLYGFGNILSIIALLVEILIHSNKNFIKNFYKRFGLSNRKKINKLYNNEYSFKLHNI